MKITIKKTKALGFLACLTLSLFFEILDSHANCRVHKFQQECESVKECVWDSRGCNVGPALEAVQDGKAIHRATVEKHPLETSF